MQNERNIIIKRVTAPNDHCRNEKKKTQIFHPKTTCYLQWNENECNSTEINLCWRCANYGFSI